MVNVQGAAITIWRLKPLTNQIVSTTGAAVTIWRFIAIDQSNRLPKFRLASLSHQIFFVNNSSRRSSRCPRTISLDDRDLHRQWSTSPNELKILELDEKRQSNSPLDRY